MNSTTAFTLAGSLLITLFSKKMYKLNLLVQNYKLNIVVGCQHTCEGKWIYSNRTIMYKKHASYIQQQTLIILSKNLHIIRRRI
jgi:DNA repair photolyase